MRSTPTRGLACLALVCGLAACDTTTPAPPTAPTPTLPAVATVAITGLPTTLTVGQSLQLTASATLPDGTRLNATGQVTWQSSAVAVASVSPAGLLTILAPGEADVTATLQSVNGTVHVVVPKPLPPPVTFDITGVVHEGAPTENVMLAGATVGIHFAGCPTCPHDNQETTTDAQGRFTLPSIDTVGFTLWVQKPGYEATDFVVAQLPRDQHPSISVTPVIHETFAWNGLVGTGPVEAVVVDSIFPVSHMGQLIIAAQWSTVYDGFQHIVVRRDGTTVYEHFFDYGNDGTTIHVPVDAGHTYEVRIRIQPFFSYWLRAQLTHPK